MPLQKQPVQLRLGPVDQLKNKKWLIPGRLTLAENVRQGQEFALSKRYGYSALDRNALTGSITSGQQLASDGNTLAQLANDTIWSRSDALAKWVSRGKAERVIMTPSVVDSVSGADTAIGYCSLGGGNGYFFVGRANTGIRYKIIDAVTGTVIVDGHSVGVSASDLRWAKISATKYAVFYKVNARAISYDIFDPTNPTAAPVTQVLGNFTGGTSALEEYDILETTSGLIAAAFSINGTVGAPTANSVALTTINSVTGLPGAWSGFTPGTVLNPVGLSRENGTSGFLYLYYNNGGQLTVRKMDVGTFANTTDTILGPVAGGNNTAVTGHRETGGTLTTYYCQPGGASVEDGFTRRYSMTTGFVVTIDPILWRATVLASTSFSLGMSTNGFYSSSSPWYVLTQHDDGNNLQRTYHVRDSTGRIVGKCLYARGGPTTANFLTIPCVPPTVNKVVIGASQNLDGSSSFAGVRLDVELFPSIGRPVPYKGGRRLAWPGGWPTRAGGSDALVAELGPAMWPRTFSKTDVATGPPGLTIATYKLTITYAQRDADGNVYRSSPAPTQSHAIAAVNRAIQVTAPTLRIINDSSVTTVIELWLSDANQTEPFLYSSTANDPTVDSITITAISDPTTLGDSLYTFGGEVSNDPPPPARWAFEWRSRLFLGGTDELGAVWASKEYAEGKGPEFSLGLRFLVGAGTGDVTAGCPLDDDFALIFRADAIFSISGAGPDLRGGGNYQPVCIEEGDGTTRPNSVVRGPPGVFYQGKDGGIWLIGHDRTRTYVGQGVDSYAKVANVTAALHVPAASQIRFWTDTGKILVFDYSFPTEEQRLGQWYVWSSSDLDPAVGACLHQNVEYHLEADGVARKEVSGQFFDGANVAILPKITLAPISFAGLDGFSRVYKGQFVGEYKSAHSIKLTATRNFGETTQVLGPKAMAAGPEALEIRLDRQQVSALELAIEQTGTDLGEGFTFEGFAFMIGLKSGLRHLPVTGRVT